MTETDATMTSTAASNPEDELQSSENVQAEWTIMIYMAGDNNLADDCVNALKASQRVKTGDTVHVVAQFDPSDTGVSTQRIVLNLRDKHTVPTPPIPVPVSPSTLAKDNVKVEEGLIKFGSFNRGVPQQLEPGETDSADPKTLFDFISWSCHELKAKRYMLVLAGHASGVQEGYLLKDENPSRAMTLAGLTHVLSAVKAKLPIKLDILAMDSCLMSMIEICYELKSLDLVDVLISSQSMTPNPGWPYGEIISGLMEAEGKLEPDTFASIIVNKYVNSYVENAVSSGLSTDLSALRVSASGTVAEKIRTLATAIMAQLGDGPDTEFNKALIHAHWEAQSYNGELFVDLCDFCGLLERHCNDEDVKSACREVIEVLSKMVVAACFCGITYQYSNGVSIYFPWSTIFSYYRNLAFSAESGADWFSFLDHYIEATRRPPRGGEAPGPEEKRFVRRAPPLGHGPTDVHSMRNPPRKWSRNGIRDCIEHKKEWSALFESFK